MLKNVIDTASQRSFFNLGLSESGALQKYVFNESGKLLTKHFYKEWLLSSANNLQKKDVYIYAKGAGAIQDNNQVWSEILRKLSSKHNQFGIIQTWNCVSKNMGIKADDYNYYLSPEECTNYHYTRILPHSEGNYYFFHWQRQRKMWWSKITSTPGLFALTDAETAENMKTVHIQAQFPWGNHIIETIRFNSDKGFSDKYSRVVSLVKLEPAIVSIFCDAMTEPDTIRFHRKIAPYKFSFALLTEDAKRKKSLSKLAYYIQSMLCKDNVSTIMPDSFEPPLKDQFKENCALGIPYTIVVDNKSLDTGILRLMSRDTTLMEQVHLADLRKYAFMLLKNL